MPKKNIINKLNKPYYVMDEYGHKDEMIVIKVNELIDIINHQQKEIDNLKAMIGGVRKH